jgi:hypothetical protein
MPNSKPIHPAQQFANDVNNGVIQADNDITVLCCAHNEDLRLQKESYFPFQFSESNAEFYLEVLYRSLPDASPCEQFLIWRFFGWASKSDGITRRYAKAAL